MSCNLHISGASFDVDNFLIESGLVPYSIIKIGDPIFKTQPEKASHIDNRCSIQISNANFNEFGQQKNDAIEFLKNNYDALLCLANYNIDSEPIISFGVETSLATSWTENDYLPSELLKLAGNLAFAIEISHYHPETKNEDQIRVNNP